MAIYIYTSRMGGEPLFDHCDATAEVEGQGWWPIGIQSAGGYEFVAVHYKNDGDRQRSGWLFIVPRELLGWIREINGALGQTAGSIQRILAKEKMSGWDQDQLPRLREKLREQLEEYKELAKEFFQYVGSRDWSCRDGFEPEVWTGIPDLRWLLEE